MRSFVTIVLLFAYLYLSPLSFANQTTPTATQSNTSRDSTKISSSNSTTQVSKSPTEEITTSTTSTPSTTTTNQPSSANDLLNQYYNLQKTDPTAAQKVLIIILQQYPNNETANLEMGYVLMKKNQPAQALKYFQTAEKLQPENYSLKLQIAFVLNSLNRKQDAYQEFLSAANAPDADIKNKAKQALQNLSNDFLSQYYNLQKTDPNAAQKVLTNLLQNDPNNATANLEMGYILMKQKQPAQALKYFQTAEKLQPENYSLKLQIAYVLVSLNRKQEAYQEFLNASKAPDAATKNQANQAIRNLKTPPKTTAAVAAPPPLSEPDRLLNQYYSLQKTNPSAAEQILQQLVTKYPNNVKGQTEMGYLLLNKKQLKEALQHFLIVQALTPDDYNIKMQIAYLYNQLGENRKAYYQFEAVTKTSDSKLFAKAQQSMINLAGVQTRFLPSPFFADIYFAPYYMYRFRDTIFPGQFRIGMQWGQYNQFQIYGITYYNQDSRSSGGLAPAIYNDNSVTYSGGIRYQPFHTIPIFGYVELGKAYNLLPVVGSPWMNDFRGGFTGYQNWGATPEYAEKLIFPFHFVCDMYGNYAYYSRYNQDWIGQLRLRPGLRIFEYGNSSVDLYLKLEGFWDTKHFFYNNIIDYGPGIAFVPNNRLNLAFRVEFVRGQYLPVNSPDPNPYGTFYTNKLFNLETYFGF